MSRHLPTAIFATLLFAACTVQRMQPAKSQQFAMDEHSAHMSAADMRAPTSAYARVSTSSSQQGTPGLPASNNAAKARIAASPRHSEWVKIPWEQGATDSIMAWVVYPTTKTKAPVVVVVHEIYGLSSWVRGVADQVAAEGFIAVAPDFNSRTRGGPSTDELTNDSAQKIIRGVNNADKNKVIIAAANYAMGLPSATQKYSVIGYCWGGTATFSHTVNGGVKGYSGGVAFYGAPFMSAAQPATATTAAVPSVPIADSLKKINAPIMLLSGSKDARIGAAMPAIDSIMKSLGKSYVGTNYEGAVHGFLRAQDDPKATRDEAEEAANLAATKDGWPKTVAFLKKNMGVK